jgi:antitoxin YefM
VQQDADVTISSRRDTEGDAVVMSLDYYNSVMETLHFIGLGALTTLTDLSIELQMMRW